MNRKNENVPVPVPSLKGFSFAIPRKDATLKSKDL